MVKKILFIILVTACFQIGLFISEAKSATCKIDYDGPLGKVEINSSSSQKFQMLENATSQCVERLRAQNPANDPEELIFSCTNLVVNNC